MFMMLPTIFFWKENEEYGCFSNWFRRKFVIDDFEYLFVEQYMMAQKAKLFHDSERYTAILRATKPWECKDLGKKVKPFDFKAWNAVKYDVVKTANRAKYEQNPDLMTKLLYTGDILLAEASPFDPIWGIGLDADAARETSPSEWPGENLLGKILMELRAEFAGKSETPESVLRVVQGDITETPDVDAIVNAADQCLIIGNVVVRMIIDAGGSKLMEECMSLHGCETGEAKLTGAYDLPCKYVIHTVGPIWRGGKQKESELLSDCYRNSLRLAMNHQIRRIAFPSISTMGSGYPVKEAAEIAVATVNQFVEEHPGCFDLVEWVLYDEHTYIVYENALNC